MKTMQYEKTPVRALVKRPAVAKMTTDMSKLSTLNILRYLYRRHDKAIWISAFWLSWAIFIYVKLGS